MNFLYIIENFIKKFVLNVKNTYVHVLKVNLLIFKNVYLPPSKCENSLMNPKMREFITETSKFITWLCDLLGSIQFYTCLLF